MGTVPRSAVTILAYHRIALPGDGNLSPTLIDAYPVDFEAQMRFLADRYNVVSMRDVVRALREGYTLPLRALAITFDDGYNSFRDIAMPILRRLGLPVTLFVPTAFTGTPGKLFWWDEIYRSLSQTSHSEVQLFGSEPLPLATLSERLAAYERAVALLERLGENEASRLVNHIVQQCEVEPNDTQELLGWEDVKALAAEGVSVGPHTRTHLILSQASPERVRNEVEGSWADLQAQITNPLPIFCYPNGQPYAVNRTAREAVARAGIAGAVTMVAGLNVLGQQDPFLMYRIGAVAGESLARFRLKITVAGRLYRRLKLLSRGNSAPRFDI